MGAVVDVLQRARAGDHQRHMAVDEDARGHRLAVFRRRNGGNIAVLDFRQDQDRVKAVVGIELGRQVVGHIQAEAAGEGQPPAQPQVGDVAGLIPGKPGVLRGRDAAGRVRFQRAEHDAGQLQDGLAPPLAGDPVGLCDGQDQVLDAGKGPLRHLIPVLEPGAEGAVGRQGAQGQRGQGDVVHRPRVQDLALLLEAFQRGAAQLVDGAARHKPRPAVHFHVDLLHRKGGAARLGQAALQALGGVGAGGLRLGVAVGKGAVALVVGDGQLLAALLDLQLHPHRHAGALAAVEFPQGGQGLLGQLRVGLAADAEHSAVDLPIQIAGGEARPAEGIFQQVPVVGTALAARQTGADRSGHVLRRAEAALDLGRGHPDGLELVQLVDDRVILEGQVVQTARLALRQGVGLKGQTAGPRTGAAVAAPPAEEGRHIALAADAHAQRAVDEALRLDAAVLGDVLHFGQTQLAGQHHAGEAQLLQLQRAL